MNSKAVLIRGLVILGIVSLVFLAGCGGSTASTVNNQPPPPAGVTVSPSSVTVQPGGAQQFTATVSPGGADQVVNWSVSGTGCTGTNCGTIDATGKYTAPATAPNPPTVTVMASSVADSTKAATATVTIGNGVNNPVPTINGLFPSVTAVGGPAFTLTVVGSNFVSSSVVRWNGSDRPTAFASSNQVSAQIPAADIAAIGTATITVFNPAPGGGTSDSLSFSIVAGGPRPVSVAVAPDPSGKFGKFAYVANSKSNNISMYTINATTGALTLTGTMAAGTSPASVAVDPSGKFAYVANDGGFVPGAASVSMYTIDGATGALTSIGAIREACPAELCTAVSVTVHPSGKFAYVGDGFPGDDVSMFTIDLNTGALTFVGTIAAASPHGSNTTKIAIDPSGKFAYAVGDNCALDTFDGEVSMYTINLFTGALSSTGSPVPAGVCPSSVTVDPFGRFVYVTDDSGLNGHQDDNVATYAINGTTGALTFFGFAGTGMGPSFVAVDPTGKFAYVTNFLSSDVSMYTINGTTGALTSIGTIAAGTNPVSVAVDPTGKFAYVTNSGSNNVSIYSIDVTTGALTLIGTVGT